MKGMKRTLEAVSFVSVERRRRDSLRKEAHFSYRIGSWKWSRDDALCNELSRLETKVEDISRKGIDY